MTNPAAFLRCLEKGIGRAHLVLQSEDPAPYREALLSACVENIGYYTTGPTERSDYLLELIDLAGEPDYFVRGLISALEKPAPAQDWLDRQLIFGLLRRFAARGFDAARAAMYESLSRIDYEEDPASELVRLDGEPGLVFAGEQLLRCGNENLAWEQYKLLDALRGVDPATFERQRAQPAAPWILAALEEGDRISALRDSCQAPRNKDYAEVRRLIQEGNTGAAMAIWGEHASEEDLLRAADDLLLESDPVRLLAYLRIFSNRPFPHGHPVLLPLARHESEKVAWSAVLALSHFTHPEVRALGEEFSRLPNRHEEALRLLARNSCPEDWALVEQWVNVEMDVSDYHDLGFSAVEFVECNLAPAAAPTLIHIYEHGGCEYCRQRVVEHLLTLNCLPDWMRTECRYDAAAGIRALMDAKTPAPAERVPDTDSPARASASDPSSSPAP